MIREHRSRMHQMLRPAGCLLTLILLYGSLSGLWSNVAWGQQSPTHLTSPVQAQALPRRSPRPTPAANSSLVKRALAPRTIALPVTNPASALGSALVSCDKEFDDFEPVSLQGAKGEINLDQCYRGRDHLVCTFNALLSEAKFLLEKYRKIVDANYPELGSVDDLCRNTPAVLVTELENITEFTARFKAFRGEYDARTSCASRIKESLRNMKSRDMTQAPAMVKSMIDAIEADIRGISAAQAQLAEFRGRINSSRKAIPTILKLHRTICVSNQSTHVNAENHESGAEPVPLERTGNR
jgi:hypothetical protein